MNYLMTRIVDIICLKKSFDQANKEVEDREEEYNTTLKAKAESEAIATYEAAGGITPGQQNPEIAKTLAKMQRKYIENLNTDALEVACIAAMDRPLKKTNTFRGVLQRYDTGRASGIQEGFA